MSSFRLACSQPSRGHVPARPGCLQGRDGEVSPVFSSSEGLRSQQGRAPQLPPRQLGVLRAPRLMAVQTPRPCWTVSYVTSRPLGASSGPSLPAGRAPAGRLASTPLPAPVFPSLWVPCSFFMASIRGRRQRAVSCREREQAAEWGGGRQSCMVIKHCRGLNKCRLPPLAALEEKQGARPECRWPGLPSARLCLPHLGLPPKSSGHAEPHRT